MRRVDLALFGGRPRREVLRATVTPLASIFGSGFLIVVPILERALGALAVVGMAAVCALAWLVGGAIRHNVVVADQHFAGGGRDGTTVRLERASDLAIVVASRAFAGYYALQCALAAHTCEHRGRRAAFAALATVMLAITVLAKPAG